MKASALVQTVLFVKDDIPPFVIAGGNPCRVIEAINEKDLKKR